MLPGPFGSTTIDCCACVEKANTQGNDRRNRSVVAIEPVWTMAADISNDRALGGNLRLQLSSLFQAQGETSQGKILGHHCRSLAVIGSRMDFHLQGRCQAGRTNESAPTTGALPNCIQSDPQAASLVGWTSRTLLELAIGIARGAIVGMIIGSRR